MARGRLYIPSSLHYAILQHLFEPSRNRGHQGAVSSIVRMTFIMNSVYEFTKGNFHPQR